MMIRIDSFNHGMLFGNVLESVELPSEKNSAMVWCDKVESHEYDVDCQIYRGSHFVTHTVTGRQEGVPEWLRK